MGYEFWYAFIKENDGSKKLVLNLFVSDEILLIFAFDFVFIFHNYSI